MLETIKLVAGTVADKTLVPAFSHIHIYDGHIQGNDGRCTAIDASCEELRGVNATVPASRFLRAVNACDGEPVITEKNGKLTIKRAGFKAILPLMANADYPKVSGPPEGVEPTPVAPGFLKALKRIAPFISEDASRPWSCSVLVDKTHMYATNNVVVVSVPFVSPYTFSLPTASVDELLRINRDPKHIVQKDQNTFFLYDTFWCRVLPMSLPWPDIEKMLAKYDYNTLPAIPGQLRDAVDKISHFHPDPKFPVVMFNAEGVHTMDGEHKASVEGMELPEARFRAEMICKVLNEATKMDLSTYPAPSPFTGPEGMRGMIVGVRQ